MKSREFRITTTPSQKSSGSSAPNSPPEGSEQSLSPHDRPKNGSRRFTLEVKIEPKKETNANTSNQKPAHSISLEFQTGNNSQSVSSPNSNSISIKEGRFLITKSTNNLNDKNVKDNINNNSPNQSPTNPIQHLDPFFDKPNIQVETSNTIQSSQSPQIQEVPPPVLNSSTYDPLNQDDSDLLIFTPPTINPPPEDVTFQDDLISF